ncbi:VWA domain-containing protein, partial [Nitratireductor pacificus]
ELTITFSGDNLHATAGTTTALVDEDDLAAGIGDAAPGDDAPSAQPGILPHDYGADGAGSIKLVAGSETVNGVLYTYTVNAGGTVLTANDGTQDVFRVTLTDAVAGTYTVALLARVEHDNANGSPGFEDNLDFTLSYEVYDADDATGTPGSLTLTIDDDVPSAVDPQHAIVGNAAGAPLVFGLDNDWNVTDNYGADGAGSLRFASSLDDHASGLTSGGQPISYHLNGDGTMLEAKIGGEGGTTVFTVTLNPASGTYMVDMDGTVDSLTTVDFQDSEYDPIGGNTAWFGFASDEADSADLLLTPIPAGSSLNTSDNLIGVGGGQSVGSGEGVRLDFVRDLTGTPNTGDYDDPGNQNHGFDQHYRVNGASVLFDAITGGGGTPQSTVRIKAFDDGDTGPTLTQVGDGTQDSVRGIAISFGSETLLVSYSAGVQTVEVGGRSFTVSFVDNPSEAGIQYEAVIGGVVSGTNVAVYTNSGYNSLEVLHESGQPFKLGEFGTSVVSTDPVDLSLPIVITDGDGDTAEGAIDITLSAPPVFIVGSNEDDTGGSTDNHAVPNPAGDIEGAITGGGGDDTIFGDPGAVTITPGQTANIILVLDSSGSMSTNISFDGGSVSRMQALKNAVNDLLDSLGNSGAAHIRVNIVDFDSDGESLGVFDIVLNGDDNASAIAAAKAAVNGMGQGGGTNYEDALATAFSWIGSSGSNQPIANADLNKVLFVSDGEPTAWNSGSGGSTSFSNITSAINEMLGADGTNEVQQITGAGWSIDAIGIALGNTASEADFDSSATYDANTGSGGSNNDTAYILYDDNGVEIAQVSAWSSQSTSIGNLVDVESAGSGSSRRFGVEGGANGLNVGEVLRFDFGLGTDYDGGGNYSTGGFNGTPVTGARFDFLDFGSSQQSTIEYTIHYTDGTSEVRTHSFGSDDSNNHDIDAPDGKFIEYIAFTATATESAGYIRLDHVVRPTPLEILDMVEGPGGNAQNVTTAEELSDAIGNLGGSTDLAAAGNDLIDGGAGNDLIFGDSPFTDDLATARGLSLPAGSGWKVFQTLEATPSQNWTRADTLDYIRNNQAELGRESGRTDGDDVIDGGAGNDIIFGQEGDDLLIGGEGADILYGGTGENTYDLTEAVAAIDTVVIDPAALTNLNPEEIIGFGAEDVVDLTELFTVGSGEDVSDYARMSGSDLQVDADGASGPGTWETVAQFNVTPVNPVNILYDDDGTDTPDTV